MYSLPQPAINLLGVLFQPLYLFIYLFIFTISNFVIFVYFLNQTSDLLSLLLVLPLKKTILEYELFIHCFEL